MTRDKIAETEFLEYKTLNELLGVEDVTLLMGGEPHYITKTMGDEWGKDGLQIYLDGHTVYNDYELTVAATDMTRFSIPGRAWLKNSDKTDLFKRALDRVTDQIRRHQLRRSIKGWEFMGNRIVNEVAVFKPLVIPSYVTEPVLFVPHREYDLIMKRSFVAASAVEPWSGTMYELMEDDARIR